MAVLRTSDPMWASAPSGSPAGPPAPVAGPDVPTAGAIMAGAATENFPVASRLLPAATRSHLLAIYGFARLVDQLGDEAGGDRLAHLDWLEAELERAYRGEATHPVLTRLSATLDALGLPDGPFRDLVQANRQDQVVTRYSTFEELEDYCRLSANPVGRLVLAVFGVATPEREVLSDQVCTGLQLVEHTQDVAEDAARGRVYLPAEDLATFGCRVDQLTGSKPGPELRALIAFQVARARRLLGAGVPLAATIRGRPRIAVAGFVGGGHAALDAIERAGFDVWDRRPRPTATGLTRRVVAVLAAARRRRRGAAGTGTTAP